MGDDEHRADAKGAFWGLALGLLIGCIRMLLDFIYPQPQCYEENKPGVLKYVHYLYFSTLLSAISLFVVVTVSLATEKPRPELISRLTWFTRLDPVKTKEQVALSTDRAEVTTNNTQAEEQGSNSV